MQGPVPVQFYDAVVERFGEPFAYSYLTDGVMSENRLLPKTQTAWMRLKDDWNFSQFLAQQGVKLLKPPPFQPRAQMAQGRGA